MITTTQMYWLTRLDTLEVIGALLLGLGSFMTFLFGCAYYFSFDEFTDRAQRAIRTALCIAIPAALLGLAITVFVPNTKEMAAIWVVPKLANSESVLEIADGIKTFAVEWLEELRPGKDGK